MTRQRTHRPTNVRTDEHTMHTFKRICIIDYALTDANGTHLTLTRGHEYITSPVRAADETVMVFTSVWATVPVSLFAGAVQFTPPCEKEAP